MVRRNLEEQAQIRYFRQIRLQVKRLPILRWIHATMNGAPASSRTSAAKRQAAGQTPGVSDICIPVPMRGYHGAWIELKIKPNKLSEDQKLFLAAMEQMGYWCRVAWSDEELIALTEEYLGITLERRQNGKAGL